MLVPNESQDRVVPPAVIMASDFPPTTANPECQALVRLARAHFGVATSLVTVSTPSGQRSAAVDGVLPDALPPDLTRLSSQPGSMIDRMVIVPDTHDDDRFCGGPPDLTARLPRFYAACALTDATGRHLGSLYLLDDLPRTLDAAQRRFLHELAGVIARGLERADVLTTLSDRVKALEESAELMTLALDGSGTGVWDRNVTTGEIHYSPAWKAMLGYEPHELSNRIEDAYTRLHPDDLAYVRAAMQAHFESRCDNYAVDHRIQCKDGSYKWICSRGKVVERDGNGRALRMVGTTTDITALRETAEQLQQSVELITNLTDEVPGFVFQRRLMADGHSFFPYASEGIHEIYELTPQQVATSAEAIDALVDPRDLASYNQSLRHAAASLSPWHLEFRVQLPRQGLRWRQGDARPQRLPDGSTLWHGFITDVTERKQIENELQQLASIDFLTQLPNRRHFIAQSEAELERIRSTDNDVAAVVMFDLDHFKALNDRWGHAVGDLALAHFAMLLRAEMRSGDIVGRLGGEEFAMVLPNMTVDAAISVARRVQQRALRTPLIHADVHIELYVSIGVDIMRTTDAGVHQPLSRGDKALYLAKERGRNRIEVSLD